MTWRVPVAILIAIISVAGAALLLALPTQESTCLRSQGEHSVQVCITTGSMAQELVTSDWMRTESDEGFPVVITVEVDDDAVGVQRVNVFLDDDDLIEDVSFPFEFSIPHSAFAAGSYRLQAEATLRDQFVTDRVGVEIEIGSDAPVTIGLDTFRPPSPAAKPADTPFVFAATGDGAGGRPESATVAELIRSWNPDLFGYLGDVYQTGTPTEFYNWYGHNGTSFDAFKSITAPALGNHERKNGEAAGYDAYWGAGADLYSFDANGWHVIALDSNLRPASGDDRLGNNSEQYAWLEKDLAASSAVCTVVLMHHPVVSIGQHGPRTELDDTWALLADSGVDLVLAGHDHQYQRWIAMDRVLQPDPDGITQFVVGTGGHGIRPVTDSDERVVIAFDDPAGSFGALRLELNEAGATYAFINTDGQARDTGAIECRDIQDDEPPTPPADLQAKALSHFEITLTWDSSYDNVGVTSYRIYRDGEFLAETATLPTTFIDRTGAPQSQYVYEVEALDPTGNASTRQRVAVETGDIEETLVLQPVADTYVSGENPDKAYGSADVLRVDNDPDVRSYLRFDVVGLTNPPRSVLLRVFANSSAKSGVDVHPTDASPWGEGDVTYATAPQFQSRPHATSDPAAKNAWIEVDVTELIDGNGSFVLALSGTSGTGISLASRESPNPPELIITTR